MAKSNEQKQQTYRLKASQKLDEILRQVNKIVDYINVSKVSYDTEIEILREQLNKQKEN